MTRSRPLRADSREAIQLAIAGIEPNLPAWTSAD